MRYGIFIFEKYICELWGPPLRKIPKFIEVIELSGLQFV